MSEQNLQLPGEKPVWVVKPGRDFVMVELLTHVRETEFRHFVRRPRGGGELALRKDSRAKYFFSLEETAKCLREELLFARTAALSRAARLEAAGSLNDEDLVRYARGDEVVEDRVELKLEQRKVGSHGVGTGNHEGVSERSAASDPGPTGDQLQQPD